VLVSSGSVGRPAHPAVTVGIIVIWIQQPAFRRAPACAAHAAHQSRLIFSGPSAPRATSATLRPVSSRLGTSASFHPAPRHLGASLATCGLHAARQHTGSLRCTFGPPFRHPADRQPSSSGRRRTAARDHCSSCSALQWTFHTWRLGVELPRARAMCVCVCATGDSGLILPRARHFDCIWWLHPRRGLSSSSAGRQPAHRRAYLGRVWTPVYDAGWGEASMRRDTRSRAPPRVAWVS
jgi:hypothetical protein